jgi:hypothetical protein
MTRWLAIALELVVAVAHTAAAQTTSIPIPFGSGEIAEYNVHFGIIRVGSGSMTVAGIDSVRGDSAWHVVFHIEGGTFFYHVNDTLESWFDTHTLSSLRFRQELDEGGSHRFHTYQIFPERQAFVQDARPTQPSVAQPLDDADFFYFVRTIPLVVGQTYSFDRYFNPKSNPVIIKVLARERITVPAGTFDAIVIQPIIKTSGIFSQHGEAHIWLSDDTARVVLQLKSKVSFGSLDLYLRSFHPAAGAPNPIPVKSNAAPPPPSPSAGIPTSHP